MRLPIVFLSALVLGCGLTASAGSEPGTVRHRLLFAEYGKGPNRFLEVDEEGKVTWEHRPPSISVIFQVLPNGHLLYA